MTRVKICGITNVEDALGAAEAGADAVGLVFAPSPRRVTVEQARAIALSMPPMVTKVGVFVDCDRAEIERIVSLVGLDVVQLHGDEKPADCVGYSRPVVKRISVTDGDTAETVARRARGFEAAAILIDPGAGAGRVFDWKVASAIGGRVIVAGGVNRDNVRGVVRLLKPFGVDVSSGVEERPGKKSLAEVRAFVRAVREEDVAIDHAAGAA